MTVRAEFDEYCLRKTMAAGACLQQDRGVRQIVRCGDQVHLLTPGAHYRARFLVGADGASGQVRRLCAAGSWFSQGFALEVQTALPREEVDLTFDFASVSNGYAWIFPKGDHLNVGVYSLSSAASLTRSRLLSYIQNRLGTSTVDGVTGQYLGIGAGESPAEYVQPDLRDRVFLVGDAGGFADPLTGEGIYGALVSGQAAAKAILAELRGESTAERSICRPSHRLPSDAAFFFPGGGGILRQSSARIPRHAPAVRAQIVGQNLHPWTERQQPDHAHRTVPLLADKVYPRGLIVPHSTNQSQGLIQG